ncbi:MAG: hypothetical protein Q8922_11055 [Bacteroidota bacterium]|nr:hypothetical protein [Bacteroidota bacterium]MDP4233650.1 hypothetical protein [Bacteroidota bacterium]MDP4243090.1 hypothetical protein [Bacteroidota bacterium]MDP4288464.1 hypothetical protein [Bacteroidota bacterium]
MSKLIWVRRVSGAFALLCCLASFDANGIRAQSSPQWQMVGGNIGLSPTAIFFFDPIHGVLAGGRQFALISYPVIRWQFVSAPAGVTSIRALRLIHDTLFAATNADLIFSLDSGRTWQFSGLGLTNANDIYADGKGNIRVLTDPMKVFARLDTLNCIAQGTGNIYISSDGGLTWTTTGVPVADLASTGAFADRCRKAYVCPNSWGTAWRSVDSGKTWTLKNTGSGSGSEWVAGASVTTYLTSMAGMFRSTDDGLTWRSVITVNHGSSPFFVFGPMGEHVVIPDGFIFMATTGGLDDLHGALATEDSNGAPLNQHDTFDVPLRIVSPCQPLLIPIPLESDVEGLSATITIARDSFGDFALAQRTSSHLNTRQHDTLWLSYTPHHTMSSAVLRIDNHWQCSDWPEFQTVHIITIPTATIAPPPALAGNCKPDTEAARLLIDSCQTLVIDSVQIPPSISARLKIASPLPDTARLGDHDSLFFSFDPAGIVANFSENVKVFGHYLGIDTVLDTLYYFPHSWGQDTNFAFFYEIVPIRMFALASVALVTRDSVLAVDRPILCARLQDTSATFINKGCTPDTITSISIAGGGFTRPTIPLPIIVQAGQSASVPIEFGAPDTGAFAGSLTLRVVSGETKQIVLPLAATGYPHYGILEMTSTALDGGLVSFCKGEMILRDTIRNLGCDTLFFTPATISGTAGGSVDTSFSLLSPLSSDLLPGDSTILTIRLGGRIKGFHSGSIHFQYARNSGAPLHDTSLWVAGTIIPGESYLDASLDGAVFNDVYTCQVRDTIVTIANPGCDTLWLDSLAFTNPSFSSHSSFPVSIPPFGSLPITVHVAPDTAGAPLEIFGKMIVYSEASILQIDTINLWIEVIYPEHLSIAVLSEQSAPAGKEVTFVLVLTGGAAARGTSLRSLSFDLTHDDDLLAFDTAIGAGLLGTSGPNVNGQMTLHFVLDSLPASDTIGTLTFKAYLARADTTPLTLSNIVLDNRRDLPNDCVGSLADTGSIFRYIPGCSDGMIRDFLNSGSFTVDDVRPNPAHDEISVRLISTEPGATFHAELYDALGRVAIPPQEMSERSVRDHFTFDVRALPSDLYYLRILSNGYSQTRSVSIER